MRSIIGTTTLTVFIVSGCGKKKNDSTEESGNGQAPNAAALVLQLSTKIQTTDIAAYGSTGTKITPSAEVAPSNNFAANDMTSSYWTSAATIPNMYCGGDQACGGESRFASPKDFFDDQLNKDFKTLPGGGNSEGAAVGVMGRMRNAMQLSCTLMYHLGASGGLPAAQTTTLSMTNAKLAESNAFCGGNLQLPQEPMETIVTVKEVSGQFSRHVNIKSPFFENNIYLHDDGNVKRVLSNEISSSEEKIQSYNLHSRWYLQYDSSSKVSKLEGFERRFITTTSQGNNGGTLTYYRLTADENTNNVGVWGFYGTSKYTSGTLKLNSGTMFAGRGNKSQTNATIGFAELDSSAQDGSLRSGHPYVGCIAMDQGTFVSGGACSGFVMTASELTDSLTMVKDKIMAKSATSDWKFDENVSSLSFTIDNMTSLDPAY
jgi:hypothetical protein